MTLYRLLHVPIEKNRVREVQVGNQHLRGALGPSDFPESVRVGMDEADPATLTIEFIYPMLPEEEKERRQVNPKSVVVVGKHTGRIFGIEAKVPAGVTRGVVTVDVEPAIHVLEESARKGATERLPRRLAHYRMISELMPWVLKQTEEGSTHTY